MENNKVVLAGTINKEVVFEYEYEHEAFFRTELKIQRKNPDAYDYIPVVLAECMLSQDMVIGNTIYLTGEFRSRNEHDSTGKSKLLLYVFAHEILILDALQYMNEIHLTGFVCKQPIRRTTPGGRIICDILLAVNRACGRSDYIPCITWGRTADVTSKDAPGDELRVRGRIQSRPYIKKVNGIEESHIAYEVSVIELL